MPTLQDPVIDFRGLDYLLQVSALHNRQQQQALAVQRLAQQNELAQERFGLQVQANQWRHEKDLETLDQGEQRLSQAKDRWEQEAVARDRLNDIREASLKLRTEKTMSALDEQTQKLQLQRVNLFKGEQQRYGLPTDAFENDKILDGDSDSPGWHRDKSKPGMRYFNAPLYDNTGKPIIENNKQKVQPITISDKTFDWLKKTYNDMKQEGPSSRAVSPDAPVKHLGTYNPATGNFE